MKKEIATKNAPSAIGPYSQGIEASGTTVYVSGQIPIDPKTGEFAGDDIVTQTKQSLTNVRISLLKLGCSLMMSLRRRSFLRISRTLDL